MSNHDFDGFFGKLTVIINPYDLLLIRNRNAIWCSKRQLTGVTNQSRISTLSSFFSQIITKNTCCLIQQIQISDTSSVYWNVRISFVFFLKKFSSTGSSSEPQSYQHCPGGGGRGQLPRITAGADARGGAGDFTRNWSSDCPWDDVREWGNVTGINGLVCWWDDGVINSVSYFLLSLK